MLQIVVTKILFIDCIVFLSINIYSYLNHQFFIYVKVVSFWKHIRDKINEIFLIPKETTLMLINLITGLISEIAPIE